MRCEDLQEVLLNLAWHQEMNKLPRKYKWQNIFIHNQQYQAPKINTLCQGYIPTKYQLDNFYLPKFQKYPKVEQKFLGKFVKMHFN